MRVMSLSLYFFFSSRRRHTRCLSDWSSDVCSSDLLTTHNETARNVNSNELANLDNAARVYEAEIEGEFTENTYPADALLQLKVGAQVMFIKNDSDKNKRYYNGKLGTVTALGGDKITVQCGGEEDAIEVGKEKWQNIRYSLNKTSRVME